MMSPPFLFILLIKDFYIFVVIFILFVYFCTK